MSLNNTEDKTTKYMIMGKFDHSNKFIFEKQFNNKRSADAYAELMTENKEHDGYEYFLFEQSKAYNLED